MTWEIKTVDLFFNTQFWHHFKQEAAGVIYCHNILPANLTSQKLAYRKQEEI